MGSRNKILRNRSTLEEEFKKIEILHQKNDVALKEYLSIKENLIEMQRKKGGSANFTAK